MRRSRVLLVLALSLFPLGAFAGEEPPAVSRQSVQGMRALFAGGPEEALLRAAFSLGVMNGYLAANVTCPVPVSAFELMTYLQQTPEHDRPMVQAIREFLDVRACGSVEICAKP